MEQKQDAKHKVKATCVAFLGPKVMAGKVVVGSTPTFGDGQTTCERWIARAAGIHKPVYRELA